MKHNPWKMSLVALLLGGSLSGAVWAESHAVMGAVPSKVEQECASCHMVFPPGMLPVASWQRIMGALDKHYGIDASLDVATQKEISAWYTQHGGTYKRVNPQDKPEQDRITKSAWFVRKHREVAASTWRRPSIKSPSNCVACHGIGANKGVFEEDVVRIPK